MLSGNAVMDRILSHSPSPLSLPSPHACWPQELLPVGAALPQALQAGAQLLPGCTNLGPGPSKRPAQGTLNNFPAVTGHGSFLFEELTAIL